MVEVESWCWLKSQHGHKVLVVSDQHSQKAHKDCPHLPVQHLLALFRSPQGKWEWLVEDTVPVIVPGVQYSRQGLLHMGNDFWRELGEFDGLGDF